MKKKIFTLIFATFFFSAFSMGIGPLVSANQKITYAESYSSSFGASCSVKFDTLPFYFEFSTEFDPFYYNFDLNLSADYWLCNPEILPNWNFYLGTGFAVGADIFKDDFILNFGPRLFLGFNFQLLDGFIELFIQQTAQQNISFEFFKEQKTNYPLELPLSIGFRIWD